MNDMFKRKAEHKVTKEELSCNKGQKYYIAHHAVLKPESKSLPCHIVQNIRAFV